MDGWRDGRTVRTVRMVSMVRIVITVRMVRMVWTVRIFRTVYMVRTVRTIKIIRTVRTVRKYSKDRETDGLTVKTDGKHRQWRFVRTDILMVKKDRR